MGLREFAIRRIIHLVFVFWLFMSILFFLFRLLPGDPSTTFAMSGLSPEARQEIIESFGLDRPLYVQYIDYMLQFVQGNMGRSYIGSDPVSVILVEKAIHTFALMGTGITIAYIFAFFFGSLLGWKRGSRFERFGIVGTLMARSSPQFWTGIILLMIFVFWLGWFPSAGMGTVGGANESYFNRFVSLDFLHHLFLPALTVAIFYMATPTLLMRSSLLEILNEDYIDMKHAQGLSPMRILFYHGSRNAILPLVTIAAVITGRMFGGAVVVETVFNWPGMGRAMVNAVNQNDFPLAMGAFFVMGSITIIANFVADILYVYLDPRIEYDSEGS